MQDVDIPAKFPIPFANGAGGGFIRPIPTASQIGIQNGAASLTDGFPPLTFDPVASGGTPPFGQDFNGLLNQITAWQQWQQAGGPVYFDGAFSTAIGGYPKGALVLLNNGAQVVASSIDNNVNDPNSVATGWYNVAISYSAFPWTAGGSANVQTLTLIPAPASLAALVGIPLWVKSVGTNTGSVTLNVNGLGAKSVVQSNGTALVAGAITTGAYVKMLYDGTVFRLISPGVMLGDFVASKVSNGYLILPGGVIIQWGQGSTVTGYMDAVFLPLAFPNFFASVIACEEAVAGWSVGGNQTGTFYGTQKSFTNAFYISGGRVITASPSGGAASFNWQPGISYNWLAIGW